MRIKTELSERPPEFTVSHEGDKAVIIFYTDVVEVQREEGETAYQAVSWVIERPWAENLEARINAGKAAWLALAQSEAFAEAAAEVRARRDELLTLSDASMALDRLGLDVPSGSTFTAWLTFLRGLGNVLTGAMAIYRKALRDIPEQAGFPYDVDWPVKP